MSVEIWNVKSPEDIKKQKEIQKAETTKEVWDAVSNLMIQVMDLQSQIEELKLK